MQCSALTTAGHVNNREGSSRWMVARMEENPFCRFVRVITRVGEVGKPLASFRCTILEVGNGETEMYGINFGPNNNNHNYSLSINIF